MSDFLVTWNVQTQTGDWQTAGPDIAADAGLQSSVIVSLMTDRQADPDDAIPDGTNDPRGYWGDLPVDPTNAASGAAPDYIGSKWWLRARSKATEQTRQLLMQDARDALAWGITAGIWQAVDVVLWWAALGNLQGVITITRQVNGAPVNHQFDVTWNATTGASVTAA
jgi:phage gp46-like protein